MLQCLLSSRCLSCTFRKKTETFCVDYCHLCCCYCINHVHACMWAFSYACVCVCICVGGGNRCSPNTVTLCSLALAPIGRPHHGGGTGASVRLYGQLHHRFVCVYAPVCVSYVFVQALCLARACPSPLSAVSNLTESHTLCTEEPIVFSSDHWTTLCLTV